MGRAAHQESGYVPDNPNESEEQASPEWREFALQQRQGQSPPAEFLDGAEEQGQAQRRQHLVPGREWKRVANGAIESSVGVEKHRYAQNEEQPQGI